MGIFLTKVRSNGSYHHSQISQQTATLCCIRRIGPRTIFTCECGSINSQIKFSDISAISRVEDRGVLFWNDIDDRARLHRCVHQVAIQSLYSTNQLICQSACACCTAKPAALSASLIHPTPSSSFATSFTFHKCSHSGSPYCGDQKIEIFVYDDRSGSIALLNDRKRCITCPFRCFHSSFANSIVLPPVFFLFIFYIFSIHVF